MSSLECLNCKTEFHTGDKILFIKYLDALYMYCSVCVQQSKSKIEEFIKNLSK